MFKIAIILSCVAVALSFKIFDEGVSHTWGLWKEKYFKKYTKDEETLRRRIWEDNLQLVTRHNAEHSLGLQSFTLGMNQFADLSNEEFVSMITGFQQNASFDRNVRAFTSFTVLDPPKDRKDWREEGFVTPVKDQMKGKCKSSGWAFSATGALEGHYYFDFDKLISFSEQNLIDCVPGSGCDGGEVGDAFDYVINRNGIDTETSYPYEGKNGKCRYNASKAIPDVIYDYSDIQRSDNETDLLYAVNIVGPVSVVIDASLQSFQLYKSGLYDDKKCNSSNLIHAVLVVGYDTDENGQDYWIVKNSWGILWGMKGYIWMSRNKNNQCGIASEALFAK